MHLLIVVNPIAGGNDKSAFIQKAQRLCQLAQAKYHIYQTTGKGDRQSIRKLLQEGSFDKLVAVGGDGTITLLVPLLLEFDLSLGIVPMGSANGLATDLAIDTVPVNAFNTILNSTHYIPLDVIQVNKQYNCLHIGDIGANAQLINRFEQDEQRGMLAYFKQFIKGLQKINAFDVNISTSEGTQHCSAVMVGICNSQKYGTGIPLNTVSNPADQLFELVIIEKINLSTLLQASLASINENWPQNQQIIQCKAANIQLNAPQLLQVDGELIGEVSSLEIELLDKSIPTIIDKNKIPYKEAISTFS